MNAIHERDWWGALPQFVAAQVCAYHSGHDDSVNRAWSSQPYIRDGLDLINNEFQPSSSL